jgi:hypothetical protein
LKKHFFEIGRTGYQKKRNFCTDFKNEVLSLAKVKKLFTEKLIFLRFFAKSVFLRKHFGNYLTQEFYTLLKSAQNSASFDTLYGQF